MNKIEWIQRMDQAAPHGIDEPCTCDGCHDGVTGCTGHVVGCTCDIDWATMAELARDGWSD